MKVIWKYDIDLLTEDTTCLLKFMYIEDMINFVNKVRHIYNVKYMRFFRTKDNIIRYAGQIYLTKNGKLRIRF